MNSFVLSMIASTVIMSILIVVFILCRPLLSKFAAKWRYYAWLIILVGMLIPFRPQLNMDGIIQLTRPNESIEQNVQNQGDGNSNIDQFFPPELKSNQKEFNSSNEINQNYAIKDNPKENFEDKKVVPQHVEQIATPIDTTLSIDYQQLFIYIGLLIWALGAISVLTYHLIMHYKFMKMYHRWSNDIEDDNVISIFRSTKGEMGIGNAIAIKECFFIQSPMMIGFSKPALLLPKNKFDEQELRLVIAHELVHFKRKDLIIKVLVMIVSTLYWFNPMVYLMAKAIHVECETSCDEQVLFGRNQSCRIRYGEIIIGMLKNSKQVKTPFTTYFYESKKDVKGRIQSIVRTKSAKNGFAIVGIILLITIMSGFVFAYNPPLDKDTSFVPSLTKISSAYVNEIPYIDKITINQFLQNNYDKSLLTKEQSKWLDSVELNMDENGNVLFETINTEKSKIQYKVTYQINIKQCVDQDKSLITLISHIQNCNNTIDYFIKKESVKDLSTIYNRNYIKLVMDNYLRNWRHLKIFNSIETLKIEKFDMFKSNYKVIYSR